MISQAFSTRKASEAAVLYQRVLAIRENVLGADHSLTTDTRERLDAEVEQLVTQAHQQARSVLTEHREALDRLAQALLQEERSSSATRSWPS